MDQPSPTKVHETSKNAALKESSTICNAIAAQWTEFQPLQYRTSMRGTGLPTSTKCRPSNSSMCIWTVGLDSST